MRSNDTLDGENTPDIVTLGEPLIQLNALTRGPLRHVAYFERHVAGAELNFAIGCSRLGLPAGYISRVGADEFGQCILGTLRAERVETSHVRVVPTHPTGVYLVQRGYPIPTQSRVTYYRRGSAASTLSPRDVDRRYIASARLLHLTGITPALSPSCRQTCREALNAARSANRQISFDTNVRPQLWSRREARTTLRPFIEQADLVFTDPADTAILLGEPNPARAAHQLLARGVKIVVMKLGARGASVFMPKQTLHRAAPPVAVEDPIGAGDAFAAGFVASMLQGAALARALRVAVACGTLATTARGDWENMPSPEDLATLLEAKQGSR
jgi:2-dehydro-3-deoxygluconokinase/2-dehydro-3-deoxygalactonokinase